MSASRHRTRIRARRQVQSLLAVDQEHRLSRCPILQDSTARAGTASRRSRVSGRQHGSGESIVARAAYTSASTACYPAGAERQCRCRESFKACGQCQDYRLVNSAHHHEVNLRDIRIAKDAMSRVTLACRHKGRSHAAPDSMHRRRNDRRLAGLRSGRPL